MPSLPDFTDTPWRPWHTCLPGSRHRRDLKNCQDATIVRETTRFRGRTPVAAGRALIGVVSDGVGAYRFAEVGARVTAASAAAIAMDALHRGRGPAALEVALAKELPRRLGQLASLCGDELAVESDIPVPARPRREPVAGANRDHIAAALAAIGGLP